MAELSFHTSLTTFLMSSHDTPHTDGIESSTCHVSGVLVKSSPMTVADMTMQHSVVVDGQISPVHDLDLHTYYVEMMAFKWRLDLGSVIDRMNSQGGVKAMCSSYRLLRDNELPLEIDVIPPDVRHEADIGKLTAQKIAVSRDDLLKKRTQKARETFKVDKLDYSKIDCIDDGDHSLKLGLSIQDLLNTESDKQSPKTGKGDQPVQCARERSRSKSSSKNKQRSIIILSSDEEEELPPAAEKRKGRPKKCTKKKTTACH